MSKVPVNYDQLCGLADLARRVGTLDVFADVALQWAGQADKEIERLTAERDELRAEVSAQEAEIKRLRKLAMSTHLFEEAPCFLCGYNGPGYYQPEQHPCAALYHEAMEES